MSLSFFRRAESLRFVRTAAIYADIRCSWAEPLASIGSVAGVYPISLNDVMKGRLAEVAPQ